MIKKVLLVILLVSPPITMAIVAKLNAYPDRFAEAIPGKIYRGGFPTPEHLERLQKEFGIRTVISLTGETERPREIARQNAIRSLNLKQYRFPMKGNGTGKFPVLDRAADALNAAEDQPIFFHCQAGKQRSNATLAAYRMKHCGWTLKEALAELIEHYDLEHDGDERVLVEHLENYARWLENSNGRQKTAAAGKP